MASVDVEVSLEALAPVLSVAPRVVEVDESPLTAADPAMSVPVVALALGDALALALGDAQTLAAGETDTCGLPEASTLTFMLYVASLALSVTVTVALDGVVEAAFACTPALALRPTLSDERVWFEASVAMCKVASA